MPFYPVAPDAVRDLYYAAVDAQNTATDDRLKREASVRGHAILDVVTALYGSVTAGRLIMDADMRTMDAVGEDAPMCGGVLLRDEDAASLRTMQPLLGAITATA